MDGTWHLTRLDGTTVDRPRYPGNERATTTMIPAYRSKQWTQHQGERRLGDLCQLVDADMVTG